MRARRTFLLFAAVAALAACSRARSAAPPAAGDEAGGKIVARVAGEPITQKDVDARAAGALQRLRDQEYEARKDALDEIVTERLVDAAAKAQGVSREELMRREVEGKVALPTKEEIAALYDRHKASVGGRSLAELAPQIEQSIVQQRAAERAQAFLAELRKNGKVEVTLAQPRIDVPIPASAPVLGPEKAPVTFVEFSDYLCPYCQKAQSVVDEVLAKYPGKVRFVHRDFMLGRPRSLPVARAAHCAGEQGKFWDYRHGLLQGGGDWSDADLLRRAQPLSLDASRFQTCLASDRFDKDILASSKTGQELGVNSTPTFFINGRRVTGVRTPEEFAQIIDSELAGG